MSTAERWKHSLSSIESRSSTATICHYSTRRFSVNSLSSTASFPLTRPSEQPSLRRSSHTSGFGRPGAQSLCLNGPQSVGLINSENRLRDNQQSDMTSVSENHAFGRDIEATHCHAARKTTDEINSRDTPMSTGPKAFKRWVSTLRRKRKRNLQGGTQHNQRWNLDDFENVDTSAKQDWQFHNKSASCSSSLSWITAVKSATVTMASVSVAGLSRTGSKVHHTRYPSSNLTHSEPRLSRETQRSLVDHAAKLRLRRRGQKLGELVRTEEGYVDDLKALFNSLMNFLNRDTQCQAYAQDCAATTLSKLVDVHQLLLAELRMLLPVECTLSSRCKRRGHARWHSIDAAVMHSSKLDSIRRARRSLSIHRLSDEDGNPKLYCDTIPLTAIVEAFISHLPAFSTYETLGQQYELIRIAVNQAQHFQIAWNEYDSAVETLAYTLGSVHSRNTNLHKALTVKDLLIKPIQRLPRYVLLFTDMYQLTPVCDDPQAHKALGVLIDQLEMVCKRVNQSRKSGEYHHMVQTTWLVGDRLRFHDQLPRPACLELLGQVVLCGCLHIAYRGKDAIKGRYAICILFENALLLAAADENDIQYDVLASIVLGNASIEECDNGKGLQCHTAPYSWKMVYQHLAKIYEIIFTACSAIEANVWRDKVHDRIAIQSKFASETRRPCVELHSPLTQDMKSVGKALGGAGNFIRRISWESLRRAATVAGTTNLSQIIIKNTQAVKEAQDAVSKSSLQVPRSQSIATPSHIQTLAPRRVDRIRLEGLLSDVWTKELLPYPGMTARRSDEIRASANHVMRKFSMASITNNFSAAKRNPSSTSVNTARKEELPSPKQRKGSDRQSKQINRPQPVNFHTAPEAFLPEDFEINSVASTKRKFFALRTLTAPMERPFTPILHESRPTTLKRRQSVHSPVERLPMYSVVQERTTTPTPAVETAAAKSDGAQFRTHRKAKSKNRLLRMFA